MRAPTLFLRTFENIAESHRARSACELLHYSSKLQTSSYAIPPNTRRHCRITPCPKHTRAPTLFLQAFEDIAELHRARSTCELLRHSSEPEAHASSCAIPPNIRRHCRITLCLKHTRAPTPFLRPTICEASATLPSRLGDSQLHAPNHHLRGLCHFTDSHGWRVC